MTRTLSFAEGQFTRATQAWGLHDGQAYPANTPRITPSLIIDPRDIVVRKWYTFPADVGWMPYDDTGDNPGFPVEMTLMEREAQFEAEFPEFDKITLGASWEGRPIIGYRLGPVDRKHFVVTMSVHGNEVDGCLGTFKAFEILARAADFALLRDNWTLLFVPALNPDGWWHHTRNLRQQGSDGKYINLNRVFNWFWDELIPTSFESKGDFPEQPLEAQAILNYFRTGNAGGPVEFGMLYDQHSTEGDGHRYHSRDRHFRTAPTEDWENIWTSWHVYQLVGAVQRLRVDEDGEPDLYVRYYRSRFSPVMHGYFSSQGVLAFISEENKVWYADGYETLQSANNYRLDYTLAAAIIAQSRDLTARDGLLIEQAGTNILENSNFTQWQADETRPGFFRSSRAIPGRSPAARHLAQEGTAMRIENTLGLTITAASEYCAAAACRYVADTGSGATWWNLICDTNQNLDLATWAEDLTMVALGTVPVAHPSFGSVMLAGKTSDGTGAAALLGGGTGHLAGVHGQITLLYAFTDTGALPLYEEQAPPLDDSTILQHAATAYNLTPAQPLTYVCGGHDGTNPLTNCLLCYIEDPATLPALPVNIASHGTLASARYGACAVYLPTSRATLGGRVLIIGGRDAATYLTEVQVWDARTAGNTSAPLAITYPASFDGGVIFATAVYDDVNNRVVIMGGEKLDGTFREQVYALDLATYAITEVTARSTVDAQNPEAESEYYNTVWATKISRWAPIIIPSSDGSYPDVMMVGGRLTSSAGDLIDDFYTYDLSEDLIGLLLDISYGYARYNLAINTETTVQRTSAFSLARVTGFDWTEDGTELWCSPGTTAYLDDYDDGMLAPNWGTANSQEMVIGVRYEDIGGGSNHAAFGFWLRAVWSSYPAGPATGYRVFCSTAGVWTIERRILGVSTTLWTGSLGAAATTVRTVNISVCGDSADTTDTRPVIIRLQFNGGTPVIVADASPDRLASVGRIAVEAQGVDDVAVIASFTLTAYSAGRDAYATSMSLRTTGDIGAYVRLTANPEDLLTLKRTINRRIRNYYALPPQWWMRCWQSIDLACFRLSSYESRFRQYVRLYRNETNLDIDAPCLLANTAIPASWSPYNEARAADQIEWSGINADAFRMRLLWLPHYTFCALRGQDLELFRIEADVDNYLVVVAKAGRRWQREYWRVNVYGPHDPEIALRVYVSGALVDEISLVCYWGLMLRDSSQERFDTPVEIQVEHRAGSHYWFAVGRMGAIGQDWTASTATFGTGTLRITGPGHYTEPELLDYTDRRFGQAVPLYNVRKVRRLLQHNPRGAILAGESDPTNGLSWKNNPFNTVVDFSVRPDDTNLGTDWTTLWRPDGTGTGWRIVSGEAVCPLRGVSMWELEPRIADHAAHIVFKIPAVNGRVGMILRQDYNEALYGGVLLGYSAEVIRTSPTEVTVGIYVWQAFDFARAEQLAISAALPLAAASSGTLVFGIDGSTLTATLDSNAPITIIDSVFTRPGNIALVGSTALVGDSPVSVSEVSCSSPFLTI